MRALLCHFFRTLSRYYCIPVSEIRAVFLFAGVNRGHFFPSAFPRWRDFHNTDSQGFVKYDPRKENAPHASLVLIPHQSLEPGGHHEDQMVREFWGSWPSF